MKNRNVFSLIDSLVWRILSFLRIHLYSWTGAEYKFKDAVFWPKYLDYWMRNSQALEYILNHSGENQITVLDMGAGSGGLVDFIDYLKKRKNLKLVTADLDWKELAAGRKSDRLLGKVAADAGTLPFRDKCFDFVMSMDLMEHLSAPVRKKFLGEIDRIVKRGFILHCPLIGDNQQFQADAYDALYQKEHIQRFKHKELFTEQHLNLEYPTYEKMKELCPDITIAGDQNGDIWKKYMILYKRPLLGYFCGLAYLIKWKNKNGYAPYHSAFLYYLKQPNKE